MPRVRMIFSKRGRICFVPHVEMPTLFCRAFRRAGLRIELSSGLSPHPRISLGPALPVGVPAMGEPMEVWVDRWDLEIERSVDGTLPEGIRILRSGVVDGRPKLSGECEAALYRIIFREGSAIERLGKLVSEGWKPVEQTLALDIRRNWLDAAVSSPGQVGAGTMIKRFAAEGIIGSWSDVLVARLAVGGWSGESIQPLPCC